MSKYQLVCKKCGKIVGDFATWFAQDQKCSCGSNHAEVQYPEADFAVMEEVASGAPDSFYNYFDYLPLSSRVNIVSLGEGAIPMERWEHLERYAQRQCGIDCEVYVYRNDLNRGTGTFKDISASLAASVMKEHGVREYCLASTGNAGIAYATYLAKAGVGFTVFTPENVEDDTLLALQSTGQRVMVSRGNYGDAKREAAEYHTEKHVMISAGNIDPLRVESKRTMVFECLRQLGGMPDVYMQAVAGGTGPIAFEKGFRDLAPTHPNLRMPRMILVQQDTCDPMVRAWERARKEGFPQGYEKNYEALADVHTRISILTAANPGMYPIVAPIVRNSGGSFVRVKESGLPLLGKEMMSERGVLLGPASAVCYAGFYEACNEGLIHSGDRVLLNTGEGSARAAWYRQEVEAL
ncbi:MAG: pyridoxal-phosphate dependent enzyme [Bacteroidales bacterium]|nr:pyridoxal-phosphate dependent enzyme [Bacteroidales bacterium]MBQ9639917.1 pyridoxal-phosphate dependent enzyme [Bacteroidales bacterium]